MPYFATDDNVNLYYEDKGSGKSFVLINDYSCRRHDFKRRIPEFLKNKRIIRFDLRGHGDSEHSGYGLTVAQYVQDLKCLINYLNIDQFSLVGWSIGNNIIYEYIKQFGCDNIDEICLLKSS